MLAAVAMDNTSPKRRPFKFHDERKRFGEDTVKIDTLTKHDDDETSNTLKSDSPSMVTAYPEYNSDAPSMVVTMETNDRVSMATDMLVKHESEEEEQQQKPDNIIRRGKRKKYQKYTPEDRVAIGKYCFEHGPAAARKAFQSRYPEMSESVTRGFRDKYKLMIGETAVYEFEMERRQKETEKRIEPLPRGRPRKVIQLDESYALPTMVESKNESSYSSISVINKAPIKKLNRDLSDDEKIRIGSFFVKYDMVRTLKEFQDVHNFNEDLVMHCYRYYLKTCRHKNNVHNNVPTTDNNQKMTVSDWKASCAREPIPNHYTNSSSAQIRYREIAPKPEFEVIPNDNKHEERCFRRRSPPVRDYNLYPDMRSYESAYHRTTPAISPPSDASNGSSQTLTTNVTYANKLRMSNDSLVSKSEISNHNNACKSNSSPYDKRSSSPEYENMSSPYLNSKDKNHSPIIHYPKVSSTEINNNNESIEYRRDRFEYSPNHENDAMYYSSTYPFDSQRSVSPHSQQTTIKQGDSTVSSSSVEPRSKRFKYQKYTPEDRFNIGKLCNEIGLGATVKVYREKFPRLNESVVRTFRNRYRELLEKGNGIAKTETIERKPSSRKSSSTLVIEGEVVSQLNQFRISHIELTENLVMAVAENVIAGKDSKDVAGIRNMITRTWANSLLWKHKLIDKPIGNTQGICCDRCKTLLVCPKC